MRTRRHIVQKQHNKNKEVMYYRFQIGERELRNFVREAENLAVEKQANRFYNEAKFIVQKNRVKDILKDFTIGNDNLIDGQKIQDNCFTTRMPNEFHMFVSHSHDDVNLIEEFAVVMKRAFDVNCFVDSLVWSGKDEEGGLLQKLNKFNIIEESNSVTRYYHEPVIRTTDHVHAMLSMALMEMIDQCEMGLFVHSDNSVIPEIKTNDFKEVTLSSWIYEEICIMNHIRPNPPQRGVFEQREFNENGIHRGVRQELKIAHPLDLANFVELSSNHMPMAGIGTKWLDNLYCNVLYNKGNHQRML